MSIETLHSACATAVTGLPVFVVKMSCWRCACLRCTHVQLYMLILTSFVCRNSTDSLNLPLFENIKFCKRIYIYVNELKGLTRLLLTCVEHSKLLLYTFCQGLIDSDKFLITTLSPTSDMIQSSEMITKPNIYAVWHF